MEYEYNYPKETSSNSDDKDELSDDSTDSTWSPDSSSKEPSVTIIVDPTEETDTFINSVKVDKTENVKKIVVYIINSNGDRTKVKSKNVRDGSKPREIKVKETGVKVELVFVPVKPNTPDEVSVGSIAVKACSEAATSSSSPFTFSQQISTSSSASSSSSALCAFDMVNDYDYVKTASSNDDDKIYLSYEKDGGASWTPVSSDKTPTITVTIDENEDEDTYIESITIDRIDNVNTVVIVVVQENGDESSPIRYKPSGAEGPMTVDVQDSGVKVILTFESDDPSSVAVGPIAAKACSEAICSEDVEESSWFIVRTSSNNAGKKGLRLEGQDPWTPEASDKRPTIRVMMGEGRNVYIDNIRIASGKGVKGFSVQPMAIISAPGARPVVTEPEGKQINGAKIGEEVTLGVKAAIIVITLFGDGTPMSVGRVMTSACAFPVTIPPQTSSTSGTTAYLSETVETFTINTPEECVVGLEDVSRYYPDIKVGELVGYIDSDGNGKFDESEKVNVGDEIEEDVVIMIKDLCHNCTCEDGSLSCSTESCERDCEVHEWADWGPCSVKTCGGGVRERTRTFSPGTPAGLKCPCVETMTEKEYCNEAPCEVDGEWGSWTPWSVCSVSCGGGTTRRYRQCDSPSPANDGDDCEGPALEVESCYTEPCPSEEEKECGDNKIWSTICDGPISCYDYASPDAYVEDELCNPGCKCVAGFVDDGTGTCVEPAKECNCFDPETGNVFQNGQTASRDQGNDCEECTCTKGVLTCKEINCDRDCGYTDWSDWGECTSLMGGEMKRFREPNNPPARGDGKPCEDSLVVETTPCGNETCNHCIIDGVTYAVSEIIEYEACKKTCFCNSDGEMQCESEEETCAECPRGYELAPDALDCCKCVPKQSTCELKSKYQVITVELPETGGVTVQCESDGPVRLTTCQGACSSMDAPTFMLNGNVISHQKDCRCCSGRDYEEVDVPLTCDGNQKRTVQMQRFSECQCNVCSGDQGPQQ